MGTRCGSQQKEMANERNGHEIQRYLFCIHRAGENKNGGKNCTFPQSCQIYVYSYNFIKFNLRRCVCVCSFKGYVSFWAPTLDTTPPILLLTRTQLNSTLLNSLTHLSLSYLQTLREFPEELRGDVSMHLHREILQLPIFEAASQVRI